MTTLITQPSGDTLLNARRISALSQLAVLRHTTLEALMAQLGIRPPDVE